jgi:hypothetical protein
MKLQISDLKTLIANFKSSHPVGQSFHTGKWGFDRVCDCLNLNRCIYSSRKAAEMARAEAAAAAACHALAEEQANARLIAMHTA